MDLEFAGVCLCALIAAIAAAVSASACHRLKRLRPIAPAAGPSDERPRVSVVVPARDEGETLEPALRSVLAQRGVDLQVILVDDHSSDATGGIADRIAREDARLVVVHAPPLPPGWLGKANAMQAGAGLATGDYLLFTDADVHHHPDCLATFVRALEAERLDFISGFPVVEIRSLWEHIDVAMYVGGMGLADWMVERRGGAGAADAVAAGAFMLFRAECFRAIGGFEAVSGEMLDDLGIARLLHRQGRPIGNRFGPGLLRVQLFHGNREAFWAPTKNILLAVEGFEWLTPLMVLLVAVYFLLPAAAAAWGLAAGMPALAIAGLGAYAVQYAGALPLRRILDFGLLKYAAFPLVAIGAAACGLRALYHHARGEILWRHRAIRAKR